MSGEWLTYGALVCLRGADFHGILSSLGFADARVECQLLDDEADTPPSMEAALFEVGAALAFGPMGRSAGVRSVAVLAGRFKAPENVRSSPLTPSPPAFSLSGAHQVPLRQEG